MDFIEGLPKAHGKEVIFVVVDRLSKAVHFMALKHPYTALEVAQIFIDDVFKLLGMPKTIVSNRDVVFTSKFWKELFKLQKVSLLTSTTYHPQTDGQTEVVNRRLQAIEATTRAVKSHLLRLQSRMKSQADRAGLIELMQSSKGLDKLHTLWLCLLSQRSTPAFHISQLKKKLGTHTTSTTLPVVHAEHGHVLLAPEAILDRRLAPKNGRSITQDLVKWLNVALEDNTWED
uniref:Integrase catalytic domain-containing protein n=1 Tax=Nicotiana tabacum TaxID=4097 RepID=A0A1S4AG51_TOBAC|nr:PREDICTED: uncharacterized protein LOC107797068 [Nicotiana tabacum]